MPQDIDLSYLALDIDDRDPQAIFDAALARYQELAPNARPRNGSIETILLEAFATASADLIYALNRLPAATVEGVLSLYGVTRFDGAVASGTITITLDGTRTLTVPAGVRFSDPTTGLVLVVETETTGTAVSQIALPCTTEDPGGDGNAITAGTAVDVLDSIPYVTAAEVTSGFTGGSDPESDEAYLDRASTVFARVTSSLVLPIHFIAYLLEDARVLRATAIDLFEPGGTPGSDLGHITTYVYGYGAALSAAVKEELRAAMQEISSAMIEVHVADATIVTQDIDLTVVALAGFDVDQIADDVEAALATYYSPATWPWGRDIMLTEIIDVAADVTGVDYVDEVTTPASDVTVADDELAQAGTITVTVSQP